MAEDKALIWRTIDAAERVVAPRLEDAVRSSGFAHVLGAAARVQAATRRQLEARSRRMLHLVNLPAASDVTRLRRQVASLEREMHLGRVALERSLAEQRDHRTEEDDARARRNGPRTDPPAGPDAKGRGAQRAPRP